MGALALVALIAGGPLGMCLALAYGVVAVTKIAKVDAQYAARGETPPGARLVEKWLDNRKAAGKAPADAKPAKYGMWRYVWQRWQAAWELMAQEHQLQHEKLVNDRAHAAANGLPLPAKPSVRERSKAGFKWVIDKLVTPVGEKPTAEAPEVQTATADSPAQKADGPIITCPECAQALVQRSGAWEHPSSAGCPKAPVPATASGTRPGPQISSAVRQASSAPAPTPVQRIEGRAGIDRLAEVDEAARHLSGDDERDVITLEAERFWWQCARCQHREDGCRTNDAAHAAAEAHECPATTNEGDTMTTAQPTSTQQSGEVTGVRSAIAFANAMADAHQAHASNEGYVGSLANMETGASDIAGAQAAMEASMNAAAMWRKHANDLQQSNSAVAEAYASSPQAANKHAQINE